MRRFVNFWNIVFVAVVLWLLLTRVPQWWSMHQREGQPAVAATVTTLEGTPISLPLAGKQHIVIFWATWCGPCSFELNRLNRLVENGTLSPEDVMAVSVMETPEVVRTALEERKYLFRVALDSAGEAASLYEVGGTPTIVLVGADGIVQWKTMGLSPTLEMRLKNAWRSTEN